MIRQSIRLFTVQFTDLQTKEALMNFYTNELFADKIFYHIYPLGLSNAAKNNDFCQPAGNFFEIQANDLDRIRNLGCNALYLGPIFESTKHGYDTIDYFYVDRRLGNNEKFKNFCQIAHEKGFAIILDAVFNHTGRNFFAFRDLQQNGENSQYKDWYLNLNFSRHSCFGDSFDYDGWAGCMDLVKLNLQNPDVQNHIFSAVNFWIDEFKIDGLRLDAADVMDKSFLDKLGNFCRNKKKDFWLMGEVVHGDYNEWARPGRIDSVTNYQLFNSIWKSVNDKNFFDLSYNLNREFNQQNGIYKYAPLYNFLDNHDVNRIGSVLKNPQKQLYLVYGLLFAIPGIPSIYYGSEYGIKGCRNNDGDYQLRPSLPPFTGIPDFAKTDFDAGFLEGALKHFSFLRNSFEALQKGNYSQIFVSNKQFAFTREYNGQKILVLCNCDDTSASINLSAINESEKYFDLQQQKEIFIYDLEKIQVAPFDIRFFQKMCS